MRISRCITGLVATVIATGAVMAGSTAVTPEVYHDTKAPSSTQAVVAQDSVTTFDATVGVYHDT